MLKYALVYLALMSVLAFLMYGADKRKAKKHRWRTPELLLLGVGALGGAVGALLAMQIFRHKTRHWYFWTVNFFAVLLHAFLLWKFFA